MDDPNPKGNDIENQCDGRRSEDGELPMVVKENDSTYTRHLIERYVFYSNLSKDYQYFISSLIVCYFKEC